MDATGRNVTTDDDELISEQVAYYRARAPEYDDWFLRRGGYDQGPDHSKRWVAEIDMLLAELDRVEWGESVLEFAPGTGWWTAELAKRVESVMAVG
ncbi:MAG TPA: class I SAM-dependent methyltransferase, partial [Gemmatimonadetes bacterium]|nr:class I SAM-dependent methyltransferase [Gemmatimonadota bacterium]